MSTILHTSYSTKYLYSRKFFSFSDLFSMKEITFFADRIIPSSWMEPVFRGQWRNLLRMDHGSTDIGPNPNDVDEDTFLRNCLRCGRYDSR